ISSNPISRYSVGILYPQGNQVNQDSDETVPIGENGEETIAESDEPVPRDEEPNGTTSAGIRNYEYDETADENLDEEIGLSAQYMPSSMGITFIVKGKTDVVRGSVSFATYRNATIHDCVIPFVPDNPESYSVPPELAHKMIYDKKLRVIRLISSVNAKEIRDILERGTIPENEFPVIRQIAYRFANLCRNGYVRVPHTAEFTLDFSQGNYIDDNKELDGTTAKVTALRTR
ncbi:MAG TPA: helicase, partial [Ruminococcaceae bacterium]|nr:helicase [Oscillospiraceae bacterium]